MVIPIRLIDFLKDSYDVGGVVSLLALHGLFVLITKHNLYALRHFVVRFRCEEGASRLLRLSFARQGLPGVLQEALRAVPAQHLPRQIQGQVLPLGERLLEVIVRCPPL
jgi:hypothetical protein